MTAGMQIRGRMTFPGGVHPPEYKTLTEDHAIEVVPPPAKVVIPLSQHIGAPCKPTVSKRDTVQPGQVVGEADAFVSAPVHSPVAGTVKTIGLAAHAVLGRCQAVTIEVDREATESKTPCPQRFGSDFDPRAYTSEQICQAARDAGLVGMGGAGFPTRVKLEPNPQQPKEVLVVNGCECEPFITCDYRVMLEWTDQVLAGVRLAARAAQVERIKIGIEDNKPQAVEAMRRAIESAGLADQIEWCVVRTKYPQGGERQLIRSVLGRHVPSGAIPPTIGVCVMNVSTCAALAEAVVAGAPLTHRVVTVTGPAIAKPGNYYVPVGMAVGDLVEHCGGLTEPSARVILGGPMMGLAIADMSTPITKTTGAITFLKEEMIRRDYRARSTPCIRCGRCLAVCPEGLNPTTIAHAVMHDRLDLAEAHYMNVCMECGSCSFVCPAQIELTGYIKTGKILQARAKKRMPM